MPWTTPTLREVRTIVRDDVTAAIGGGIILGNSVLRVISDSMAGLAHLTLRYIDWLSRQFLPDTAETEWLDRHGDLWLVNADGSTGRKEATLATGTVIAIGTQGTVVPLGTVFRGDGDQGFESTALTVVDSLPTSIPVRALVSGITGNLEPGTTLGFETPILNINSSVTVEVISGGADRENDDDLRARVLLRIQNPPMGGDALDYAVWALQVPGVTRAWASPIEMGPGSVTVRFMMDDLRADVNGFPNAADVQTVRDYLATKRPVAVKDFFVYAPISEPISFTITNLDDDTASTRAAIELSVKEMIAAKAAPGSSQDGVPIDAQTIYAAWVSEAIMTAAGVNHFDLTMTDHVMPGAGSLAVLGTISYVP